MTPYFVAKYQYKLQDGNYLSMVPRPPFTPGKDLVPILQEAGWAPGPVWTLENLTPTRSQSQTVQPIVSRYTNWATWAMPANYALL